MTGRILAGALAGGCAAFAGLIGLVIIMGANDRAHPISTGAIAVGIVMFLLLGAAANALIWFAGKR